MAEDLWAVIGDRGGLIRRQIDLLCLDDIHRRGDRDRPSRIHRPGYHDRAELDSELVWARALRESGVGVPAARPTRDGAGATPARPAS